MRTFVELCDAGMIVTELENGDVLAATIPRPGRDRVEGDVTVTITPPSNRRASPMRAQTAVLLIAQWISQQRGVKTAHTAAHSVLRRILDVELRDEHAQISMTYDPHPYVGWRVYDRDAPSAVDANVVSGSKSAVVRGGHVLACEDLPDGPELVFASANRPRSSGAKGGLILDRIPAHLVHRCELPNCHFCPTDSEKGARALWHRLHQAFVEDVGASRAITPTHCRWLAAADALTIAMTGELPC